MQGAIEIRVRYPECDPMGYLHHARYLEYFELGRTALMRDLGRSHSDLEREGILFVVARIECRYRRPAHYDDVLTLTTDQVKSTPFRIDHRYTLKRQQEVLCTATSTIACVTAEGHLRRLPDELCQSTG